MAHDAGALPVASPASSSDPDRALRWFFSVVGVGVVVNLLSSAIEEYRWAWLPPTVFALAALTVLPRTGLLRREPHVGARWTRGLAVIALLVYLAVAIWGATTAWPLAVMILSTGCLWATCVLVTWPALRSDNDLASVASAVALLLLGVTLLLIGLAALREETLNGVALLVLGTGTVLYGVSGLRGGNSLASRALLVIGAGLVLLGVAVLRGGNTLGSVAVFVLAGGVLLYGVAMGREGQGLAGVALLLGGVGALLVGVTVVRVDPLVGAGLLVQGVGLMLFGVAFVRGSLALVRSGIMVVGVGTVGFGIAELRLGNSLAGVASLICGSALLLAGIAALRDRGQHESPAISARLKDWLTQRS
jgi:hypothetical protein